MNDPINKVLVVGDDDALRRAIARRLRGGGYQVLEAKTGIEALQLMQRKPDLVALQAELPDIDGYEVCRRLRSQAETNHIPILQILASFVDPEQKIRALEGGADACLVEPITGDELLATVKALLRMKRAEEESRIRERELRFLADSIPDMVWMTDYAGKPLYFNNRWFEFTGLSHRDSLSLGWGQVVHPDDRSRVTELWSRALRTKAPFHAEARYRTATGEYRWVSMRALILQHSSGHGERWFGTSTDIQEDKRRLEVLQSTERLAQAGRLAALIAHEINNPLEAITNIFYLLENDKQLSEKTRSFVRTGSSELKRISHIVRQSLSYYRKSEVTAEVDLCDLLDETLAVLAQHLQAHRITTVRQYETRAKVRVFTSEIRQVFSNLILNAIEAMRNDGRLILRVRESRAWGNGSQSGVRVLVGDTGPGIPGNELPRIFEAFYTTKVEKGTGLGLWISDDIIRKHGGRISLKSCTVPGRSGTVFSVFLPREPALALAS
jgi:PAS domain S-box-containing protein